MITVRCMKEQDIEAVAAMERDIFSVPWSAQAFYDVIHNTRALYLVAEEAGTIAGYCGMYQIAGEGDIMNVAVRKERRNRGIAAMMLQKLLEQGGVRGITEFTLEVRAGNRAAICLYEKLGFITEGIRRNFYEKPTEDALIMWKR